MSSYTAADAVSDVDCILRDFQCSFVMDPWMTVSHFQDSILGAGTSPSAASSVQDLPSVCRKVSDHNDSVKYLKFVTDAFMCESSNVSRQGKDKDRNIPTTTATTPAAPLDITTPLNQTEFLQQIPFSVSVSKIVQNNSVLRDMCNSEITEKQLQKDIERDQLVIDGQRIIGSNDGLEKCLLAVGDAVDSCLVSCFLPSLGPDLRAEVARVVLATVSRTNSGGVALHTLRSITDTEQVMLFPHSTEAGSLLVKLSVGRFCHLPDGTTFAVHDLHQGQSTAILQESPYSLTDIDRDRYMFWGLRGEVQATTVYKVVDMADAMEPDLLDEDMKEEDKGDSVDIVGDDSRKKMKKVKNTIEVTYENCVCLALDTTVEVMEQGEVWGGGGRGTCAGANATSGHVSFRFFQPKSRT